MNSQKIKQLLKQLFTKHSRNQSVLEDLNRWYDSLDEQRSLPQDGNQLKEKAWEHVVKQIQPTMNAQPVKKNASIVSWLWRAAILLIFCGAGYGLYRLIPEPADQVRLEAGTFTNEIGKVSVFSLPDGSKVWLSTGSTLQYAEDFPRNRQVKLYGEAFFDVARNPEFPFQISTGSLVTEVLGTSFNLRSYNETEVDLSVYSGRVKFSDQKSGLDSAILLKGEKVSWSMEGGFSDIALFDLTQLPEWRQGKIVFENADLATIEKTLQLWYNVDIAIDGKGDNCHYTGEFTQVSLEQILETLSYTLNLTYKINNAHVTILAKPCE